jgi:hypothetical protein
MPAPIFRHPLLTLPYESSQAFISTNPDFLTEWSGVENQLQWGKQCLKSVELAYSVYGKQSHINIRELFDFFAQRRFYIACTLEQDLEYGIPRGEFSGSYMSPHTPERLRSKNQYNEIKSAIKKIMNKTDAELEVAYDRVRVELNIAQQPITVSFHYNPESHEIGFYTPRSSELNCFFEAVQAIWEKIYSEKDTMSATDKYKGLATILWHLAIARPLMKGSAGTSELVYHTLCYMLNLPLLPILSPQAWDIKAFFTLKTDEYAKWFADSCVQLELQSSIVLSAAPDANAFFEKTKAQSQALLTWFKFTELHNAFVKNKPIKAMFLYDQTLDFEQIDALSLPKQLMYDFFTNEEINNVGFSESIIKMFSYLVTLPDSAGKTVFSIAMTHADEAFIALFFRIISENTFLPDDDDKPYYYTLESLEILQVYFFPKCYFLQKLWPKHQELNEQLKALRAEDPEKADEAENNALIDLKELFGDSDNFIETLSVLHRLFAMDDLKYEQQLKKIRLFIQEIIEDSSLAGDLKLTWKAYCDIMVTAHEITQQPLTILEKRLVDRINIQLETTHDLGVNGDDSKIECKEFLRNMLLELPKASPQFLGGAGIEKSAQHPEEGSDHASKPSSKGFGASES